MKIYRVALAAPVAALMLLTGCKSAPVAIPYCGNAQNNRPCAMSTDNGAWVILGKDGTQTPAVYVGESYDLTGRRMVTLTTEGN